MNFFPENMGGHPRRSGVTLIKVKNPALRFFYLNAEKSTSLGTAGYVRTRQIL